MRRVLFLDIDGVLVRREGVRFDPECIQLLEILLRATGARPVIISSYRNKGLPWLRRLWKQHGLYGTVADRTPQLDASRGAEIAAWLKSHQVSSYVIIDDNPDELLTEQRARVVEPDPRYGLRAQDVLACIKLFGIGEQATAASRHRGSLRPST